MLVVGEKLLQDGKVFIVRPLQLHAVSQELRFAKPTSCNGDAKTDLGHILDFMCRLRYLKVTHFLVYQISSVYCSARNEMVNVPLFFFGQILGSKVPVGTSNIHESSLPFDLSLFKSLHHIEVNICLSISDSWLIGIPAFFIIHSSH